MTEAPWCLYDVIGYHLLVSYLQASRSELTKMMALEIDGEGHLYTQMPQIAGAA